MALADEVYQSKHSKEPQKKEKKSFSEAFIPHKGDSKKEIRDKLFTIFALLVLIACVAVLVVYFYHQYEAKSNNNKINVIYNNASSKAEQTTASPEIITPDIPEEQRPELIKSSAAEEMLEINPDYAGYLYIPDVLKERFLPIRAPRSTITATNSPIISFFTVTTTATALCSGISITINGIQNTG